MLHRIVSLTLVVLFAFSWQSCQDEKPIQDALDAIPVNAPIVIEINHAGKALEQIQSSEISSPFIQGDGVANLTDVLQLASKISGNTAQNLKHSFYAFSNLAGAEKYSWALLASEKVLENTALQLNDFEIQEEPYGGATILSIQGAEQIFYASKYNGVLCISAKKILVEEVILQMESGESLRNNNTFMDHHKVANSSDPLSVFVNWQHLPELSQTFLASSKPDWLNQLGTWGELDIYLEPNGAFFNGAIINADTTNYYLNCMRDVGSVNLEASSILPSQTVAALSFGTENFWTYIKAYQAFLKKKNKYRSIQKSLDNLNVNPQKEIYPYVSNEFGLFYAQPKNSVAQSKMAYIKMKNPEDAIQQFVTYAGDAEANYREFPIYRIRKDGLLPLAFGRAFKGLNTPYFVMYEEWMVFANDITLLKSTINDWISGKTWDQSESFQNLKSQLDAKTNIWFFYRNPGGMEWISKYMDEDQLKSLKKEKDNLTKADWFSVQIRNKGEANLINGILIKQPEMSKEASQVWTIELGAAVEGKPQFIYNHATGRNNLLIQSEDNKLFWITPSGEVLWEKQLDSPMLGEARQIDLFRNNKLQLAFATKGKFYVVDRLGRDVEPFPVAVNGTITAPLAVFDYDKSRNYRFLICTGKKVYNYNGEGKVVQGWEFKEATSPIRVMPKHYALGNRDYIVVAEENGKVNVLNRKGQSRVELKQAFPMSDQIFLEAGPSIAESRFMRVNKQGQICYLFLNDKKDSVDLNFDENPQSFTFDGSRTAFVYGDYFQVKDQDYPFQFDAENQVTSKAGVFKSKSYLYYTFATADQKVFALNGKGELVQGFPVYGNSESTVGKFSENGKPFLVAGSQEGTLYLYRLTE